MLILSFDVTCQYDKHFSSQASVGIRTPDIGLEIETEATDLFSSGQR